MKKYFLLFLCSLFLISGCKKGNSESAISATPFLGNPPLATAQQTLTNTELPKSNNTLTRVVSTTTPEQTLQPLKKCITLNRLVSQPPNIGTPNANRLVLREPDAPHKIYLYDLSSGIDKPFHDDKIEGPFVSPDNSMIAFHDAPTLQNNKLIILGPDNNVHTQIPWDTEWTAFWGWLDNEHLMVTKRAKEGNWTASLIVLGLDDKSEVELISDELPKFNNLFYFLNWQYNFVIYDPTLSYAVYPAFDEDWKSILALSDVKKNEIIKTLSSPFDMVAQPIWSPDGTHVLVAGSGSDKLKKQHYYNYPQELFLADKDGKITQITHFVEQNVYGWFDGFNWSPNGQVIAYWFMSLDEKNNKFGFINLKTMETTDYCMSEDIFFIQRKPVWSPDGNIALVSMINKDEDFYRMAWFDVDTKFGTYWDKKAELVGWWQGEK